MLPQNHDIRGWTRADAHNFAQVMTTVTFRIPTHRALRGGMMIGAEVISLAELMQ
jgi:hypothetical protein